MLRVIGVLADGQILSLAGIAGVVGLISAAAAVRLHSGVQAAGAGERLARTIGAAMSFAAGVWMSTAIAALAVTPDGPVPFSAGWGAAGLLAAAAGGWAMDPRWRPPAAIEALRALLLTAGVISLRAAPSHLPAGHGGMLVVAALSGLVMFGATFALLRRHRMFSATLTLAFGMLAAACAATAGWGPAPTAFAHAGTASVPLLLAAGAFVLDQCFARREDQAVRRLRFLADAGFEGLILERDGIVVDANCPMADLAGRPPSDLVGRPLATLLPHLGLQPAIGRPSHEPRLARSDGSHYPVEVLWRDVPAGRGHIIAVRELPPPSGASAVERQARLDPLTGLLSRESFEQQGARVLVGSDQRPAGVAVLVVVVDRLEVLAELLGAASLEQLLLQVAQRIAGSVRQGDILGRLSREEFAVLQGLGGQGAEAATLADRIVEELSGPFSVTDQVVPVNFAVGISLFPTDGPVIRDLIRNATLAAQQAKRDGKNRWRYFESGMGQHARKRQVLQRDLRAALKRGQFTLNYQPFLDATTLEIVGYEALLRWDHPESGLIPPADFIPVAEACGLIVPIGAWVLATACAEATTWRRPATIAVNLSPAQVEHPGIVETVADVLKRTGLPPERLELEVTETTLLEDRQKALEVLTALKGLGVHLAMDDFGTGYSSLSYLRTFPFDKLKIDRTFIGEVEHQAEDESLVQAIIAMGMSLHLTVTAEGVETKQQLAMLRAYGCNYVQGYLLGRPRSASQIEGRIDQPPRSSHEVSASITEAISALAAARPA